jgi:hypothetical protein
MRPRTTSPLVTTRAPIFFARSQPAALLMLASGAIVVTSVPFRLRMLSMDIISSHRVAQPPISLICVAVPVSPPLLGGMPWKPFSSTRSVSISYRREAVSRHRGPPNRSVVGKLTGSGLRATSDRSNHVCSYSQQRTSSDKWPCPFCATSGLVCCSKGHRYSITSSARCWSCNDTSRPSAFAVLRLTTNSNLLGCMTGRLAGFSPLRIRPV